MTDVHLLNLSTFTKVSKRLRLAASRDSLGLAELGAVLNAQLRRSQFMASRLSDCLPV